MSEKNFRRMQMLIASLAAVAIFLLPLSVLAQTKISYHNNKFKTSDDLQLGHQAAQEAELLTRERYKYGLATVTEVADAQRLLAQAEIENAVARLSVWRALLVTARLQGDLGPFLRRVK